VFARRVALRIPLFMRLECAYRARKDGLIESRCREI
jgi:hypothetical protein